MLWRLKAGREGKDDELLSLFDSLLQSVLSFRPSDHHRPAPPPPLPFLLPLLQGRLLLRPMPPSTPLLPTLARRLSFGSTTSPAASLRPSSSSSSSSSSRRSISTSAPVAARRPDEWSYPSAEGDNKPRRPFLNPDVSDWIPNEVAIRAGCVKNELKRRNRAQL